MRAMARTMPRGRTRTRLMRRAGALALCGSVVRVRECVGCGTARDGTGILSAPMRRCSVRGCPCCERHRSGLLRARLMEAVQQVPVVEGYRWRLVTLSPQWDPSVAASYSVEGLRARYAVINKATRKLASRFARFAPGAGAWLSQEMAHGHIHAHALVYGPWLDQPLLAREWCAALTPTSVLHNGVLVPVTWAQGFVHVRDCGTHGQELERAVLEATKYTTKAGSPMCEDHAAGDPREVMDPVLSARWSVAVEGRRLTEAYGALRGLMRDDEEEDADDESAQAQLVAEEAEGACACRACGGVEWRWGVRDTEEWVRECHARGMPALHGSRWKPPPAARHGARHARSTIVEV